MGRKLISYVGKIMGKTITIARGETQGFVPWIQKKGGFSTIGY
jgi:hypothetical protein